MNLALGFSCRACGAAYTPFSNNQKTCSDCTPTKGWMHRYLRYKITYPQAAILLAEQKGRCALCRIKLYLDDDPNCCIDHDHETGEVRGLLCRGCNMVISRFEDKKYRLRVKRYLAKGGDLSVASKERTSGIPRL